MHRSQTVEGPRRNQKTPASASGRSEKPTGESRAEKSEVLCGRVYSEQSTKRNSGSDKHIPRAPLNGADGKYIPRAPFNVRDGPRTLVVFVVMHCMVSQNGKVNCWFEKKSMQGTAKKTGPRAVGFELIIY